MPNISSEFNSSSSLRPALAAILHALNSARKGTPLSVSVVLIDNYVPEENSSRQDGYIYVIWHNRSDGKKIPYIGETGTTLEERKASHIYQARSRARQGLSFNPAGLYFAIIKDECPEKNFSIEMVRKVNGSVKARKQAEAEVLAEFKSNPSHPFLYNLAPNGGYHSGGSGNKQSCVLIIDNKDFIYTSLQAMFRDVALLLDIPVKTFSAAVRQRLKLGYSWGEALKLVPHVDRRRTSTSLQREQMIREQGGNEVGIKSKQVRIKYRSQPTKNLIVENFLNRSSEASRKMAAAAKEQGVSPATRRWRLDEIRRGVVHANTIAEVIAHCTAPPRDRRTIFKVVLPNGTQQTLGVNEWASYIRSMPREMKIESLSNSGIKRRLKSFSSEKEPTNDQLLWALGLLKNPSNRVKLSDIDVDLVRRNRYDGGPKAKED